MADRQAGDETLNGDQSLSDLEDSFGGQQADAGYEQGLELGRKAGHDEGLARGLAEGAKLGSEVGFYKGFTMTWLHLLQYQSEATEQPQAGGEEAKVNKILGKLNEILQLVDDFPKTNETFCEEKLANIRNKFKQSTFMLQLKM